MADQESSAMSAPAMEAPATTAPSTEAPPTEVPATAAPATPVTGTPATTEHIKNIVLVGKTGNGKSSTGNTLLGAKEFICKRQAAGVTMECKAHRAATQNGPIINIIDTPGLFDIAVSAEVLSKEIIKCLTMAKEGIHAVLFVLSTNGRITPEEESTLNAMQRIFESKILDYFIVVFTGGDALEEDGQTLDDYLEGSGNCPEFLTRVLRLCGHRKVLFDNKTKDEAKKANQLQQLLAHIADVEKQTDGIPYTDKMHQHIKEENDKVREQEREIESKNLAEAESKIMHEKLQLEHEKHMIMMAATIENTLKKTVEAHEKEMKESAKAHEREIRVVEDSLKHTAANHERDIRQMREEFLQNQQRQQMEDLQKQTKENHERDMRQMKEEFQQKLQRQHMEDTQKQNAANHEREIHQMKEENQRNQAHAAQLLQQAQQLQLQAQQFQQHAPVLRPPECNIM